MFFSAKYLDIINSQTKDREENESDDRGKDGWVISWGYSQRL